VLPVVLGRQAPLLHERARAPVGEADDLAPDAVLLLAGDVAQPVAQRLARARLEGGERRRLEPVRGRGVGLGLLVAQLARQLVADLAGGPLLARVHDLRALVPVRELPLRDRPRVQPGVAGGAAARLALGAPAHGGGVAVDGAGVASEPVDETMTIHASILRSEPNAASRGVRRPRD